MKAFISGAIALLAGAAAMVTAFAEKFEIWEIGAISFLTWLSSWLGLWLGMSWFTNEKSQPTRTKGKLKSDVDGQQNVAPQVIGDNTTINIHQSTPAQCSLPTMEWASQA